MLYEISDLLNKFYISNTHDININYNENNIYLKNIQKELKIFHKFLSDNENKIIIKNILQGRDEIKDLLKITKQKNMFLKSYKNDENYQDVLDFNSKLEDQLENNFSNNQEVYDYLMYLNNFLESIDYVDNPNKYVKKFLNEIIENKKLYYFDNINPHDHPLTLFIDSLAVYMDHYTIYRMLRKFDGKEQENIIFYGGSFHSKNIYNILKNTNYFDILIKQKNNNDYNHDCQILTRY
jgi:hypothetical protein